jgi:hypothetical protein
MMTRVSAAAMNFFTTSTRSLLQYEAAAGVRHRVALSVVGTEDLCPKEGRPIPSTQFADTSARSSRRKS